MFDKFKEEIKKSKQTVSSYQYMFSIKLNITMLIIEVIGLSAISIYVFCLQSVWRFGFFPLILVFILCFIQCKGIKWLKGNYDEALKREEQQKVISEQNKSEKGDTNEN